MASSKKVFQDEERERVSSRHENTAAWPCSMQTCVSLILTDYVHSFIWFQDLSCFEYSTMSLQATSAHSQIDTEQVPPKRLENLGNSCYLNASLHTLFSCPPFMKSLKGKRGPLTQAVYKLYTSFGSGSSSRFVGNPKEVKAALDVALKDCEESFVGNEQHDAQESLNFLLNCMHDEAMAEDDGLVPTDKFFRLVVRNHITCESCQDHR